MWLLVAREPTPDAPYWPGRRLLAAVDAAVWPLLWVLVFSHAPKPVGLVGPFVAAVAFLFALGRLHRALWINLPLPVHDVALGTDRGGVAADGCGAETDDAGVTDGRGTSMPNRLGSWSGASVFRQTLRRHERGCSSGNA